jgi:protein TonB
MIREMLHRLLVLIGAVGLTLGFFLVLPVMQTIKKPPTTDLTIRDADATELDAPEPPPQKEPEKEPEPEEEPPELAEESPLLDLAQLELALNPGLGGNWFEGEFAVSLNPVAKESKQVEDLFDISDLDQKPRVVYQPGPTYTNELRRKAPGSVSIIFIVDQRGRVVKPAVQSASDPAFERPALDAVRRWKFEPGKRNGEPVRFRMRVPIRFPKG